MIPAKKNIAVACLLAAAAFSAAAQATSPAGVWRTIDDGTKKDKSLVRIVETNGVYTGKVEKFLDPETPKDAVCKDCSDDRKDKPILGMTIIRNMKQSGDDKAVFEGGDILDPNNGKVYQSKMRLVDNGSKLEVRGFVGISLLGRTQTWVRAE
ncbi:MAG TPA: DUF2147 domain-containing protein [Caldimonas sp.]|nr:DUF2147 domain-containing protein [Caldimonas sp.]